ncbi:hypothetical protein, partial [Salmonella enterica]
VSIVAVTVLGLLLGAGALVPGLSRLSNANMLMMTAGMLTLLEGLMLVVWGSQPYALPPFMGMEPVHIFGVSIPTQGFWIIGTTGAIITVLWYL